MKFIHRLKASVLLKRAKRQHRKLDRFIQESAREICAWRQEIAFLENDARHELELAGVQDQAAPAAPGDDPSGKVVPIETRAA